MDWSKNLKTLYINSILAFSKSESRNLRVNIGVTTQIVDYFYENIFQI